MISAVAFAIAAVPAAIYLMLLGRFRLSRQPLVTTGWRDAAALGIAIMGLVAIGPMQLFFPTYAAARFAGWVWGMLLGLYLLSVLLVVLGCRPRLIVYGLDEEGFLKVMHTAAQRVDAAANWQGQILTMPAVGLQLVAEPTGSSGVQTVVSLTSLTSVAPWMQLERELVTECRHTQAAHRGWAGVAMLAGGAMLLIAAIAMVLSDPAHAIVELKEFFNR